MTSALERTPESRITRCGPLLLSIVPSSREFMRLPSSGQGRSAYSNSCQPIDELAMPEMISGA
jgi:hypothetical protein